MLRSLHDIRPNDQGAHVAAKAVAKIKKAVTGAAGLGKTVVTTAAPLVAHGVNAARERVGGRGSEKSARSAPPVFTPTPTPTTKSTDVPTPTSLRTPEAKPAAKTAPKAAAKPTAKKVAKKQTKPPVEVPTPAEIAKNIPKHPAPKRASAKKSGTKKSTAKKSTPGARLPAKKTAPGSGSTSGS